MTYEYKLYLGQSNPDGHIGDHEVQDFMAENARELPGYTLLKARGYWAGHSEPSTVVIVVGGLEVHGQLRNLGQKYCRMWKQNSVLLTMHEIMAENVEVPMLIPIEVAA